MDDARHRAKLIVILKDIYDDSELRTALGFKGGTAAMLFYDLPRFSVDLDFDLLKASKEDFVFEKAGSIFHFLGATGVDSVSQNRFFGQDSPLKVE